MGLGDELEQVDRTAAAALDVVGVDRAPVDRRERLFQRRRLTQPVGVERDLDVVAFGRRQRGIDHLRGGAEVLVDLQRTRSKSDEFVQERRVGRARAEDRDQVQGHRRPGREHRVEVAARVDPKVECPGIAHRGDRRGAGGQRGGHDLGPDQMDMAVHRTGGRDQSFPRDHPGGGADRHRDGGVDLRITGAPERNDAAAADPDRGLAHAEDRIEQHHVRDAHVECLLQGELAGAQLPFAHRLAHPDQRLRARTIVIGLHGGQQVGVGQSDAVAGAGAVERRVLRSAQSHTNSTATVSPRGIRTLAPAGNRGRAPSSPVRGNSSVGLARATGKCEVR